jgi:hypothetical protein
MNDVEKQDLERGPQPEDTPAPPMPHHALQQAMNTHLWCWTCGATDAKCAGYNRTGIKLKCCPDCRHPTWQEAMGAA